MTPFTESSVVADLAEEATRLKEEMKELSENRDLDVSDSLFLLAIDNGIQILNSSLQLDRLLDWNPRSN